MAGESNDPGARRRLRFGDDVDPDFQRRWLEARRLDGEQVDRAFRHGFDSRDRFAERPFREVEHLLRESWDAMGPSAPWEKVADIVRSGYERYKGAGFGPSADLVPEALDHFPQRTQGGSAQGGVMGDRPLLGASEPVSEYEGEGGPPVVGEEGGPGSRPVRPDVNGGEE